jgi:alkylhydroperoxidase/carboxymuconolactone decarboxylase family protein YurZ
MTNRSTLSFNQREDAMALKEFAGVYFEEALDEKTRQLVAMAAMAAAGCTS